MCSTWDGLPDVPGLVPDEQTYPQTLWASSQPLRPQDAARAPSPHSPRAWQPSTPSCTPHFSRGPHCQGTQATELFRWQVQSWLQVSLATQLSPSCGVEGEEPGQGGGPWGSGPPRIPHRSALLPPALAGSQLASATRASAGPAPPPASAPPQGTCLMVLAVTVEAATAVLRDAAVSAQDEALRAEAAFHRQRAAGAQSGGAHAAWGAAVPTAPELAPHGAGHG